MIKKLLITAVVLAALAAAGYLFGGPVSRRISAWLHPANDDPVPTLSLQPHDYRVVVSAGVSSVIGGQLDVQLVRLAGDEVVVDVGVENGRGVSFHAGPSPVPGM